ncbi:1,4-alpha-glucan branching protein [Streptomyces sp. NBC_00237]|uniref:maltokinase N-terminal cap-like domain-containing protein n=1 Tax=Streptomyces sp. NBC_00237 TaxID=2975687 RepID=UPI0022577B44|nr:1,4-alpha-glucan branching protein [Streptomyces sp. NBC_00237]MCX5205331.1 1,4-alpha-glucan branching protein [Streptomyces sp. NBC_00237]
MATIHDTTVTPTKLEVLTAWLPTRPWYQGTSTPQLAKAGGFRLDDPEGTTGMEFMVVTDTSGDSPVAYHVPVTYRGVPLEGAAEQALIGTMEHGVLGPRWMYDGPQDPVLAARLLALLQNRAEPQQQSVSDTPDPTVVAETTGPALPDGLVPGDVREGKHDTAVTVRIPGESAASGEPGALTLSVTRVLRPDALEAPADAAEPGGTRARVTADWTFPDGTRLRGTFAALRPATD